MDSSFDNSFNTTLLEDHQLDVTDFLMHDEQDIQASPVKKSTTKSKSLYQSLSSMSLPNLPCSFPSSSNDLFQMTHHLRKDESLQNDKVQKLVQQLQGENEDFDLDDQVRTRVFKARASVPVKLDPFDMQLDSFLRDPDSDRPSSPIKWRGQAHKAKGSFNIGSHNENKENVTPVAEPSKRKLSDSVKKAPVKKSRSYASIPLLNSMSSASARIGSTNSIKANGSVCSSPKRICVPKGVSSPGKPNIKSHNNLRIFLVDSSTGSVDDATQFGTELNASNCEGFPLPDNVNEVVQIPTNDAASAHAVQKMAIIKASMGSVGSDMKLGGRSKKGFYSQREFEELRSKNKPMLTVFKDASKRVRWADDLEW